MKKLLAIVLCFIMCCGLCACGSNSNLNNSKYYNSNSTSSKKNYSSTLTNNTTSKNTHTHSYSAATCTSPSKCSCGATQGSALGHQYSRGYCIRCNEKDPNYIEYGTIQGTVTYKYNNYVGNRGDSGAIVILFPNMTSYNTKKYDNSRACLGMPGDYESGIKVKKCDGNGNYVFDNVPVGKYYILIISAATTDGGAFDNKASRESWIKGNFSDLLSETDIEKLILEIGYQKIYTENVDVLANRTHTISKDFGITYI